MKKTVSCKRWASVLLCLSLVAALCLTFTGCGSGSPMGPDTSDDPQSQVSSTVDLVDPDEVVATARIVSTGDILIHSPFLEHYYNASTDTYDFHEIFQYVKPYITDADYAIANLEVSLGGEEAGPYSGFPCFNCPDAIVDALTDSGFDMLLTANNHVADTGFSGFERTHQVLTDKNIPWIGTQATAEEKRYQIIEVNGIKIGVVNYTYVTHDGDTVYVNGIPISEEFAARLNYFDYNRLDEFYTDMEQLLADMKADGAQASLMYIHWGEEYHLSPTEYQEKIAQKICNIGFDAIIGGHPHVVEPVEVLTSETTGKKMVCLYSMGNELSNQRHELLYEDIQSGHTEDGLLFYTNFEMKGDGTVTLTSVEVVPTWVHMYYNENNRRTYEIVPLKTGADWSNLNLSASDTGASDAQESYDRTMALVGDGVAEYNATGGRVTNDKTETSVVPDNSTNSVTSSVSSEADSTSSNGTATVITVDNVA